MCDFDTPFRSRSRHLIKVRASVTGHNLSLEDVQDGYTADLNRFPVPQSGNEFSQTCSGAEREEMRVLTFAELKSLIEQGKTDDIPNNKLIPNVLNVSRSFTILSTDAASRLL